MTQTSLDKSPNYKRFIYTKKSDLVMPEYGRHINILVEFALRITDREERTRCAKSIIVVMGNLFPHLRDVPDFNHKLWDHLAIMSDFKLDIDTPFPLPDKEHLVQPPAKVPYQHNRIRIKHYGKIVVDMLEQAINEPDPVRKRVLTIMLGNHMKKALSVWNKDSVTDERIFSDMRVLSNGRIELTPDMRLIDFREMRDNRTAISSAASTHIAPPRTNNPTSRGVYNNPVRTGSSNPARSGAPNAPRQGMGNAPRPAGGNPQGNTGGGQGGAPRKGMPPKRNDDRRGPNPPRPTV